MADADTELELSDADIANMETALSGTEPEPAEGEPVEPAAEEPVVEPPVETQEAVTEPEEPAKEPDTETDAKAVNRRGYAERQALKSQVNAGVETPPTAEQLIEKEGLEPELAEVEALRQEVRRDKYVNELTELNAGMNTDAQNVQRDFAIFRENNPDGTPNPEYDKDLAVKTEELYRKAANLTLDPTGKFVVRADTPLYEFYALVAEARQSGTKIATADAQRAAERNLSAAEPVGATVAPASNGMSADDQNFLAGLTGKKAS